jgi:hypothetical protein
MTHWVRVHRQGEHQRAAHTLYFLERAPYGQNSRGDTFALMLDIITKLVSLCHETFMMPSACGRGSDCHRLHHALTEHERRCSGDLTVVRVHR